jgi:bacterioferritin-associated ferredoxin
MSKQPVILCRCEDITQAQVRAMLEQGYTTFEDLKRQLRVGMGPCQGQTCGELIQREIASFLGKKYDEIPTHTIRPMTTGVKLKAIKEAANDEER